MRTSSPASRKTVFRRASQPGLALLGQREWHRRRRGTRGLHVIKRRNHPPQLPNPTKAHSRRGIAHRAILRPGVARLWPAAWPPSTLRRGWGSFSSRLAGAPVTLCRNRILTNDRREVYRKASSLLSLVPMGAAPRLTGVVSSPVSRDDRQEVWEIALLFRLEGQKPPYVYVQTLTSTVQKTSPPNLLATLARKPPKSGHNPV